MHKCFERTLRHAEIAKEYLRQAKESDRFDIDKDVVPKGHNVLVAHTPFQPPVDFPINKLCEAAIDFFNNNNDADIKYEFHEFAYANAMHGPWPSFCITFLAKAKQPHMSSSFVVAFEAFVRYRNSRDYALKVVFCRLKAPPKVEGVQVVGDVVEGNVIKGVGHYLGGRQGPSKFEWFRSHTNITRNCMLLLTGSAEYTLTGEDVGHRLLFKYTPVNSVGQVGEPVSIWSRVVEGRNPLSEVAMISNSLARL